MAGSRGPARTTREAAGRSTEDDRKPRENDCLARAWRDAGRGGCGGSGVGGGVAGRGGETGCRVVCRVRGRSGGGGCVGGIGCGEGRLVGAGSGLVGSVVWWRSRRRNRRRRGNARGGGIGGGEGTLAGSARVRARRWLGFARGVLHAERVRFVGGEGVGADAFGRGAVEIGRGARALAVLGSGSGRAWESVRGGVRYAGSGDWSPAGFGVRPGRRWRDRVRAGR